MGFSQDYPNVPDWVAKSEGYQTGAMVKYKGNIFYANFWASEPGVGDADHNGWRLYDELYDQTPHTPTQQAKIIAYIPTWRKKEGLDYANAEMYQYITHGIVAFLMFSETNLGEFDPASVNDVNAVLSDVVSTGHQNGTYISVGLGGATDYGFLNLMTAIGNNPADPRLAKAVQNVKNFVEQNGLDGIDLDLECWWDKNGDASKDQGGRLKSQGPHPAGYALTLFAQQLKQVMPTKLVSATLFGTSWYGNNYDPQMANYVDWLAVMTYDLTGSWNASPVGPHSALLKIRNQGSSETAPSPYQESYIGEQQGDWSGGGPVNNPILSVEDTLWYWTNPFFMNWQGAGQTIPRHKIAAGVPIYGYDFAYGKAPDDLSGQIPPGYQVIRYKDILTQFPNASTATNGNLKVSGSTPRPPFISVSGNYPFAHNIYFETPDTAVAKLNFLKNVGAQGVIIWELSNDVWEEGQSVIKALYKNSGNPATRPPLQRYNKTCFLCTHNAYKNYEDHWTGPSQSFNLYHQLEKGVRSLMLDIYYEEPSLADVFEVIPASGVYVLGEVNEHGWIAGITYALPAIRLHDALNQVGSWLNGNQNDVVTIFLEDYTTPDQLETEIALVNNAYQQMMYNPNYDPWKVKDMKAWPFMSDLIAWNKRLILFSDHNGGVNGTAGIDHDGPVYVAYDRDFTKQNYWSLGSDGTKWDCPSRWNNGMYLDADYPKLFLFNHYRDVPTTITASLDNTYEKIMDRIDNRCAPTAKQLPNFIGVDFFEVPLLPTNAKKAGDAVAEINRRFSKGVEGVVRTHSTDAGRYGGSQPSDMVQSFIALAANGHEVDRAQTTQGVLVELVYTPGNMDSVERQKLLGELLIFAKDQQSWHGDWFLWNLVTVSDIDSNQNIRLTIG